MEVASRRTPPRPIRRRGGSSLTSGASPHRLDRQARSLQTASSGGRRLPARSLRPEPAPKDDYREPLAALAPADRETSGPPAAAWVLHCSPAPSVGHSGSF